MSEAEAALSCDALLGGRVRLWQPRRGYRAATDPVFLAAACPARPGERVLDLGCGAGAAALCLAARVPALALHGLELQPDYAALARRNALENGAGLVVHEGDVAAPPPALRAESFDHVIANPPYFAATDAPSPAPDRDAARREGAEGVGLWIDAGLRRLRQGGALTLIHRAERLDAILVALEGRAGAIEVLPLCPRAGRPAGRVLLRARKDRRGPLRLLWPFVIHEGAAHAGDAPDFTEAALAMLRDGAPAPF
ncbi:MAG: tRNA1(Val) (adenine(37)-N6)-methyltransferase [Rubrimonas sp.]|uniref:tRNA1(Val) (adenine(37)-N6)-methyltransferase n=1 Tax=Rubrimonas sp. TaxID=2036015 RepID=UPI002FDDB5A5